jgi:hypothetical protein
MDERARAILETAFANVERHDAERADVERDLAQRAVDELFDEKDRCRSFPDDDQKARHRAFSIRQKGRHRPYSIPQEAATMDVETLAKWNAWFDDRLSRAIQKRFEDFADILGEQAGQLEKRLNTKIAALEAEIELLRGNNAKNITPLRSIRDSA